MDRCQSDQKSEREGRERAIRITKEDVECLFRFASGIGKTDMCIQLMQSILRRRWHGAQAWKRQKAINLWSGVKGVNAHLVMLMPVDNAARPAFWNVVQGLLGENLRVW